MNFLDVMPPAPDATWLTTVARVMEDVAYAINMGPLRSAPTARATVTMLIFTSTRTQGPSIVHVFVGVRPEPHRDLIAIARADVDGGVASVRFTGATHPCDEGVSARTERELRDALLHGLDTPPVRDRIQAIARAAIAFERRLDSPRSTE